MKPRCLCWRCQAPLLHENSLIVFTRYAMDLWPARDWLQDVWGR